MSIPIIDVEKTGENIKKLRKKRGLTVSELQGLLGIGSISAIYHWENGTTLPSIDNLVILAAIYRVRLEDILIYKDKGE